MSAICLSTNGVTGLSGGEVTIGKFARGSRILWSLRYAYAIPSPAPNSFNEGPYLRIAPSFAKGECGEDPIRGARVTAGDAFSLWKDDGLGNDTHGAVTIAAADPFYEIDAMTGGSVWLPFDATVSLVPSSECGGSWVFEVLNWKEPIPAAVAAQEKRCQTRIIAANTTRVVQVPMGARAMQVLGDPTAVVILQNDAAKVGSTFSFPIAAQNFWGQSHNLMNARQIQIGAPAGNPVALSFEINLP